MKNIKPSTNKVLKNYTLTERESEMSLNSLIDPHLDDSYYSKLINDESLYSMIVELEKNNTNITNEEKARKLISISRENYQKNLDKESRFLLETISITLCRNLHTLKAYAWTCINTGRYEIALEVIRDLENIYDYKDTDNLRNSLRRKRIINISFLELAKSNNYEEISEVIFNEFSNEIDSSKIIDFILIELMKVVNNPKKIIPIILIKVGKLFAKVEKKGIEISLVEAAVKFNKDTSTVRASFWAYQRSGRIEKSKESLYWLYDYARESNNNKLMEFVELRKKSYLFLTTDQLLQFIEEAKLNRIEGYKPNFKSIAYVLHNSLPYASGGYATRGHGLATALAKNGYNVNIITRPGFPLDTKKELQSSDVIDLQNIEGVEYHTILEPRKDKLSTFEYIEQAAAKLIEKFEVTKPSLVVGASNHLTALPALIAARKLGIPFVYEVRGFWEITRISREPEFEQTEWYKLQCSFEALTASQADHVFTLTTPMAEELERRGVNKNHITILPNSCNPERFEPTSRNIELADSLSIPTTVPIIGYIGTFVQYEGLEHLAEACGLLKQKGVEFRLLVVGNENTAGNDKGPITQKILDVAAEYGFSDWLVMPGRIPHDEVEAYYSLIDIAPFPRKPQPVTEMVSPMKPLEAAAMKKAILVSSVRALTDMITDGQNGLVFEKGNIDDFAEKLLQLVAGEELRIQLGESARQWVETERTWEITSEIFSEKVISLITG